MKRVFVRENHKIGRIDIAATGHSHKFEDGYFDCDECGTAIMLDQEHLSVGFRVEEGGNVTTKDGVRRQESEEDTTDDGVNASDAAVKLAKELNVDLSTVEGTGSNGLITKADVQKAAVTK